MEIPRWGFAALVVGALAIGGTVGALGASVASDDDSDRDRLERANAKLTGRLDSAQEDTEAAEDAASETQAQVEQLQADNAALAQQVSDLQAALADAEATPPPTSSPTTSPVPSVLGPGAYEVGVDMPAGTYRSTDAGCQWQKFERPFGVVIDGGVGPAEVVVDSPWFVIEIASNAGPRAQCFFTKVG